MLDISLLLIGQTKEKYYQAALVEYQKRLQPYVRLRLFNLKSLPFTKHNQKQVKDLISQRIEEFLLKYIAKNGSDNIYLLAERGKLLDSIKFSHFLSQHQPLLLVLGGTLGFSDRLYQHYPQLSLSPLTFPHELAQVVLLEQIYRASTLTQAKTYHY